MRKASLPRILNLLPFANAIHLQHKVGQARIDIVSGKSHNYPIRLCFNIESTNFELRGKL